MHLHCQQSFMWPTRVQETHSYRQAFNRLRDLKPQIEQLQALLQRSRIETRDDAFAAVQDASLAPAAAAAAAAGTTDANEPHQCNYSQIDVEQPQQAAAGDQPVQSIFVQQPSAPGPQPDAAAQPAVADGIAALQQPSNPAPSASPNGVSETR
jgi:hypothetical protein